VDEVYMEINWLLLALYIFTIIVEIGLPVTLGVWLMRKYKSSWVLIITGMITYALAELIHIPALNGLKTLFSNGTLPTPSAQWIPLLNGVIVGLMAGLLENILRWIAFKVNGKRSNPFRSAVSLAVGHGGVEIALVGVLLAINLSSVLFYNPGAEIAKGATAATVQSFMTQIASYWSSPWYYSLLSLFEHLVTFSAQFALTVMVWKSVTKNQPLWLLWAVLYQMFNEGITTFLSGMNWGMWEIEGVLALFLLLNLLMMYFFWNDEGGLDSGDEDEGEDENSDTGDGEESDEVEEKVEDEKGESDSPAVETPAE
jgi:uncharacterized membrane protein YhfC